MSQLMKSNAILIVAGEPNSVFLEIFFKSFKVKKYTSPIVIIASKNLLVKQMKFLGFNHQINLISKDCKKLDNKKINLIDVNYNFKKSFDNITKNSNSYITECFNIALGILKKKIFINSLTVQFLKNIFYKGGFWVLLSI